MGVLFASMPLAWLGTKAEAWIRNQEQGSYNKLLNWVRNPGSSNTPGTLILRSLTRTLAIEWLTFFVAILALKFFFETLFTLYPSFLVSVDVKWSHLWVSATLGGLMALRLKRAYAVLATGISLFVIFTLFGRF